ncbi:MAG: hypothetical protein ACREN2_09665 [Candidatus Dormibacteria bacterium]
MVMEAMPNRENELALPGSEEAVRHDAALHRAGTLACTEAGCTATTGIACAYIDRRRHHCETAWCPAHRLVIGEAVYCRRHAGVVSAISNDEPVPTTALPDLDNRAPSLVAWMTRALDGDVWAALLGELGSETGGQLVADPVTLVFYGIERRRAWERCWKLVTHTGVARRVSILVEENDDATVMVKVGSKVVDSAVPPWIEHRRNHESVNDDNDALERSAFNERLMARIRAELRAEQDRERNGWQL